MLKWLSNKSVFNFVLKFELFIEHVCCLSGDMLNVGNRTTWIPQDDAACNMLIPNIAVCDAVGFLQRFALQCRLSCLPWRFAFVAGRWQLCCYSQRSNEVCCRTLPSWKGLSGCISTLISGWGLFVASLLLSGYITLNVYYLIFDVAISL